MKSALAGSILAFTLLASPDCAAQANATLVVSEDTLNRLIGRLGVLSQSGTHQPVGALETPTIFEICEPFGFVECPELGTGPLGFSRSQIPLVRCRAVGGKTYIVPVGEPVLWQWWVTGARFSLQQGSMTFIAVVRSRIDGRETTTTRTVPASVVFDSATNRVVVRINAFTVALEYTAGGRTHRATAVDVAKLYGIAIPVEPQTVSVPGIQGGSSRTVVGKVAALSSVTYRQDEVEVAFDLQFNRQ